MIRRTFVVFTVTFGLLVMLAGTALACKDHDAVASMITATPAQIPIALGLGGLMLVNRFRRKR